MVYDKNLDQIKYPATLTYLGFSLIIGISQLFQFYKVKEFSDRLIPNIRIPVATPLAKSVQSPA